MTRPTFRALLRDIAGSAARRMKGKPARDRARIGKREIHRGNSANEVLLHVASSTVPLAVSRLGTTENAVVKYYVENQQNGHCSFPENLTTAIRELSGFFPPDDELLSRFCRESLEHMRLVDVMAVRSEKREHTYWKFEDFFVKRYSQRSTLVDINALVPLGNPQSWTRQLKGRRVLVIHPFARTVAEQYMKRNKLFDIPDFLPDCEFDVLPAVQSIGDNSGSTGFPTWFDALEFMKAEMTKRDFEVALIGAGAYGLFLAAECKRLGRIGIHIGGASQLLFGILGRRWTDPTSPDSSAVIPFVNEHWIGPAKSEVPQGAEKVEGACYWL